MRKWLFILLLLTQIVHDESWCQLVNISGVINIYTPVLSIDSLCTAPRLTVESSMGFQPGDRVLVIQMKGVVIDRMNQPSFGRIDALGSAGKYEFGVVQSISGQTITLRNQFLNRYDVNGTVQLIRVPVYRTAGTTSKLRANPWNGRTGGVLVLEADSLVLLADIDVSGMGFRGGRVSVNQPHNTIQDYYFAYSSSGGEKGEGCSVFLSGFEAGRGPYANGGGGGNAVNTGGGGGGNFGRGGKGGKQYIGSGIAEVMGIGGYSLPYSALEGRVFLGGGGGGGHQNDGNGTSGGAGGGIIILRASTIAVVGQALIRADGEDVLTAGNDGAGGGGSGGSVLISVDRLVGVLPVSASGGKGGDVTNDFTPNHCHGPGGGGAGGIVWVNNPSHQSQLSARVNEGQAGLIVNTNTSCYNTTWGAEPGEPGGASWDLILQESTLQGNPIQVQSTNRIVCPDSCTTLAVQLTGGVVPYRILWSPSTGLANPTDSITRACPPVTTSYIVLVMDAAGCQASMSVTVTVLPRPAKPIITRSGDSLLSSPAASYQWYLNGIPLPGAVSQQIGLRGKGQYTVQITDDNGCIASSDFFPVDVTSSSTLSLSCTDSVRYDPGEIVRIPVLLTASENLHLTASHEYDLWLHFDKYVMQPIAGLGIFYRDTGRTRIVRISGERDDLLTQGTLIELPAIVTLGDTICTTVHLDSIVWKDPNVVVKIEDSLCVICVKVCEEGGTRLFYSRPRTQIRRTYPNPFNSGTVIEYVLARDADVRLSVFDLYGRAVASLVQEPQAVGEYRLLFDAQRLPSGIYLLTLQTADGVDARLLSLIK